jgi:flagellar secretion chaperone FliS
MMADKHLRDDMWKNAYLESRVTTATPAELTGILYEAALDATADARASLARGDTVARSGAISRAMSILSELEASLDHRCGGKISRNMAGLYQYMQFRLVDAHRAQSDEPLAETERLLSTLREAWKPVEAQDASQADESEPVASPACNGPSAYGVALELACYSSKDWCA